VAFTSDDIARLTGATVLDPGGDPVGRIGQVYLDPDGSPSWATVRTGFLGTAELFFPLDGAAFEGRDVRVPFAKASILGSPRVDSSEELDTAQADELADYYAAAGSVASSSGAGPGQDGSSAETAAAMTRSEERLRVGTRTVERGRVRLRKHIVTEQQTVTVPVSHEEAFLVREPIREADRDAAAPGRQLSEEEHEIVLHGEFVVTSKEVVPVERIRVDTRDVVEEQQLTADVRQERIDVVAPGGTTR
jgi:uncharacterized protein (TIGR02271 family)